MKMDLHDLSFGKIILINDRIAEVIINEGVEMNADMVDEYHRFLLSHLNAPFSLLVNKINAYTYDFEAQQKIANLSEINKMAVVSNNHVTTKATEYLKSLPSHSDWDLKIFSDRDAAMAWLLENQSN